MVQARMRCRDELVAVSRFDPSRRHLLIAAPLLLTGCALDQRQTQALLAIEAELGGRVGVSALDTRSGMRFTYRSAERFALCSTFKALLAAAVLARIDAGLTSDADLVRLTGEALLSNSPVSGEYASKGAMPLLTACEAIVSHSDNTAANLLLRLIGGPAAMTQFFRGLGDDTTRLDRYELELNSNIAGDARDTTTPEAMMQSLRTVLLGDALTQKSRDLLTAWMVNEQRGKARIRAGVPGSWRVANKPGTSANGATNDIAVAWPIGRDPICIAIYVNAPSAVPAVREAAIARVAGILIEELGS